MLKAEIGVIRTGLLCSDFDEHLSGLVVILKAYLFPLRQLSNLCVVGVGRGFVLTILCCGCSILLLKIDRLVDIFFSNFSEYQI